MVVKRKGARIPVLPHHEVLVQRLLAHYSAADADTIYAGRTWYDNAHRFAQYLATTYGFNIAQTAYVIAAISPNVSWRENMATAENACAQYAAHGRGSWMGTRGAGYGANKAKSEAILMGDLQALNGPKVTCFAEAILGNPESCTVDIWMQRATGFDSSRAPSKVEHRAIKLALEDAARRVNETIRDFQAIVWVQVRDNSDGQIKLWHRNERNAA